MLKVIALFLLIPTLASAEDCREIRFAKGAYSGVVQGSVGPETDSDCFLIGSGAGQTMSVQVVGDNVAFSVYDSPGGMAEGVTDTRFTTRARTYQMRVFQMFRSIGDRDYKLTVTIR